jgi:hypothetical protein
LKYIPCNMYRRCIRRNNSCFHQFVPEYSTSGAMSPYRHSSLAWLHTVHSLVNICKWSVWPTCHSVVCSVCNPTPFAHRLLSDNRRSYTCIRLAYGILCLQVIQFQLSCRFSMWFSDSFFRTSIMATVILRISG